MDSHVRQGPLESHHEMRTWVQRRHLTHLNGVKNTQNVELTLLRHVRRVGKERKGHFHDSNLDRQSPAQQRAATNSFGRLAFSMAVSAPTIEASDQSDVSRGARWHTDLLMVLMATIWGFNFPVLKYATQFMSPLALNGFRIPIAAASQLLIARGKSFPHPSRSETRALILLGMLGNGVYQVFFILGLVRARVATAALMIAATPALVAVLGRIKGTERLTSVQWAGVIMQLTGCSTVALGAIRNRGVGENTIAGVLLLLGSAVSWAFYSVSLKRYSDHVDPWYLGGYTMLGGAIVMGAVGLPAVLTTRWVAIPSSVWLALFYATFIAMVVAYLFYYRGLKVLGATRTSMYSNLQPLIAMGIAWVMLHEKPTGAQVAGAALIIGGLLLARYEGWLAEP